MSIRHVARRVVVSIAATAAAGSIAALAFSSPAGAAGPASGSVVPGSAQPVAPFATGKPFSSGQNINIVIPANSAFASPNNTTADNVVECSAPNGVVPTQTSACDGNTVQGGTILPAADGSFTYTGYTVYNTPDTLIGDTSTSPVCGSTSATECILYIGNNQNDFTAPHLWSQPFFVNKTAGDTGANPGDGTPEVPMAILLPLSAMGLLGGAVLIRRRRRSAQAA
jgi:hypothetical protein